MKCGVCGEESAKSCSKCKLVGYCGVEHQKSDWERHKISCGAFEIKEVKTEKSKQKDTFLKATRDLPAGLILLEEDPIFWVPMYKPAYPCYCQCLTCGLHMTEETLRLCTTCQWPLCSVGCEKLEIHAINECIHFTQNSLKFEPGDAKQLAVLLTLIRLVMMKQSHPKNPKWAELLTLGLAHESPVEMEEVGRTLSGKFLPKSSALEIEKLLPWFDKLCRMMTCSAPGCSSKEVFKGPSARRGGHYLYPTAAHTSKRNSCTPNCVRRWGNFPRFLMQTCVLAPIKKGEELTFTAIDPQILHRGTWERREALRTSLEICCSCQRCSDPRELKTFSSAIRCPRCRNTLPIYLQDTEYLLPVVPAPTAEEKTGLEDVWLCQSCAKMMPRGNFYALVQSLKMKLEVHRAGHPGFDPERTEEYCEGLIQKYRGFFLHPNHWLIQEATEILLEDVWGPRLRLSSSKEEMDKFIKASQWLMELEEKLIPGFPVFRGDQSLLSAMEMRLLGPLNMGGDYDVSTPEKHREIMNALSETIILTSASHDFHRDAPPVSRTATHHEWATHIETTAPLWGTLFTELQLQNLSISES